jgi:hypothetical protein
VLGASPMTLAVAAKPDPQTPSKASSAWPTAPRSGSRAIRPWRGFLRGLRLRDPALRALIAKSEVAEQPGTELTEGFVQVHLTDGRALRADVPLALGNPGNPMSWAGMEGKFAGLVEPALGKDTRTLFEALRRFEEPGTLAKVMTMLTRAAH